MKKQATQVYCVLPYFKYKYKEIIVLLLLLFINVGSARLRKSDVHPISPKTPAPQYQPIGRKTTMGKE